MVGGLFALRSTAGVHTERGGCPGRASAGTGLGKSSYAAYRVSSNPFTGLLAPYLRFAGTPGEEEYSEEFLPLYLSAASCGFPSPADDYVDKQIDIRSVLVRHPAATFYLRASGSSMIGAGINDGDLLVVDRSAEAVNGRIVIAASMRSRGRWQSLAFSTF